MILLLLIQLLIIIITYLVMRWRKVKNYWADRNVPCIPPHPIWGNLTFLQKVNPSVWMKKVYEDYPVPYVGIWLIWRPALIINCPIIARNILSKDSDNFRNRFLSSSKSDVLGSLNLLTVKDPLWTYIRRKLSPVFTVSKLKFIENIAIIKCNQLLERTQKDLKNNMKIDIRSLFSDYTTDVISHSMFGMTSDAMVTGDSPMRKVTKVLMHYNWRRGLAWSSIFFVPELVHIFRFSLFPKYVNEYLTKIFRAIIEQRGGYESVRSERDQDLIDILIKVKQSAVKENKDISEEFLLAQAAAFLQGGFDTTAVALTHATYELAFQPEMQDRLYEEISEAKRNIGGADFDLLKLQDLTYLNAVIKETLRKYPPMGWLDRVAEKDYEIDDKLTIKAGTNLYVNCNGLHYDPKYFPEPYKFDPERFMPENKNNIIPYTYLPFGEGPRSCIGKRFGIQNMLYVLSTLILNFKWKPYPGSPLPNDTEVNKRALFLMPGTTLSVDFEPRD